MQNWLRLGNTVINLDQVQFIIDTGGFSVYVVGDKQPINFAHEKPEGRALASWLKTHVSPMIEDTESVSYFPSPFKIEIDDRINALEQSRAFMNSLSLG